jgi:predicted anti-sigma-YlaC factor YlaD
MGRTMKKESPYTREHDWVQDHLPSFVNSADDLVEENQRKKIESHLRTCDSCAQYEQLLRTMYADQTAEDRRSLLPEIQPERIEGWDEIIQRKGRGSTTIYTTAARSEFWRMAAIWLVAGLITGGMLTNQWTSSVMDSVSTNSVSTNSVMNESDTYWFSFEQAVNQQWIETNIDWNQTGESNSPNTLE